MYWCSVKVQQGKIPETCYPKIRASSNSEVHLHMTPFRYGVLKKHPGDSLTKIELLMKLMCIVRLEVERCATLNSQEAILKGYQAVGFVLI